MNYLMQAASQQQSAGAGMPLVLDMKFHGNITDDTGNGTTSSAGITYSNGVFSGVPNNSATLNSDSDNIFIEDNDLFSFADATSDRPFKIEFDFKPTNLGQIHGTTYAKFIIHKRGDGTSVSPSEWQIVSSNSSTAPKLQINLFDEVLGGNKRWVGSTTLVNNVAYSIVIEYDGSGGMSTTINGVTQTWSTTDTGSYTRMRNTNARLKIGSYNFGSSILGMKMDMENLKIWKSN